MADFMDQEAMESDDDNMSDEEVKLRENTRDNIFAQDILFFSCKIFVRIRSAYFTLCCKLLISQKDDFQVLIF